MAHTPGLWSIDYCADLSPNIWVVSPSNSGIAKIEVCDYGDGLGERLTDEDAANARLIAAAPVLLEVLTELVNEFSCTIEQYHRIGPCYTRKDGTETFDVCVILDREHLIEKARAAIAQAHGNSSHE